MRRAYLIVLTLLLANPSLEPAVGRDVKEIGLRALRRGRISTTKPARDFTRIPPDANYAPDRLLVRFAPNADLTAPTRAQRDRILSSLGGSIEWEYDLVPGLALVTLSPNLPVNENTLRRFNNVPGVLYAQPDYEGRIAATPNDQFFANQWALYDPGHSGAYDINAKEAWDVTTGSDEIVVAVLDSGVNYNHADLTGNMWVNTPEYNGTAGVDDDLNGFVDDKYGYDFCTRGQSRDSDPKDDQYHGSHVAGIIGAFANNYYGGQYVGIVGVCWHVRIMAVKWQNSIGSGWASDAIAGMQYATMMGAHVINASWVVPDEDQGGLEEAIAALQEANITFVAAAGNHSYNLDTSPEYPAAYACDNIISVLSIRASDGHRVSESNYSTTKVDLGAPGADPWELIPYNGIYSCLGAGTTWGYYHGTSQAAPHVAGACALLLSINPSLSYTQVKSIIMDNVTPVTSLSGLCVTGGILNLHSAVTDPDVELISDTYVVARDSSGANKAWVDRWGNLVLKGALQQNQSSYPSLNGLKVRNSVGTVIAALDRENGNLLISGQCHEFQTSPLTPTNANWVIKDSDGAVLAYLDSSGHLYMTGEVFDGI